MNITLIIMRNNNKIRQLKRDPAHKKATETRDVFVDDDNFDHREATSLSNSRSQKMTELQMIYN
jgi:hypothetical protein